MHYFNFGVVKCVKGIGCVEAFSFQFCIQKEKQQSYYSGNWYEQITSVASTVQLSGHSTYLNDYVFYL